MRTYLKQKTSETKIEKWKLNWHLEDIFEIYLLYSYIKIYIELFNEKLDAQSILNIS